MKQRLIGAAVLVALAVIFLPMLLDSPAPEPGAGAVALDIPPPPDRHFETRSLPLELPSTAPVEGSAADPVLDADRVVTVDANPAPRVDALPETARPQDPAAAPAPSTAASAGAPEAPAPADAAAASATPDTATAGAPAPAASPQPPPAAVRDARFVVNLGSFANTANARALLGRLKAAGIAAFEEPIQIDAKPALRLRAGPYAARADAEAARMAAQRLQAGLKAVVVSADSASEATPAARSGFAVQVGAFRDASDAQALSARLRDGGLAAFVDAVDTDAGRMHRVRIGPEAQRSQAEALRDSVARRFQLDALVVTHP